MTPDLISQSGRIRVGMKNSIDIPEIRPLNEREMKTLLKRY